MIPTSTSLSRRYPGPRPFIEEDAGIFKGRQQEIEDLLEHIKISQHLLVYSKSGIGKSSLLNAGILPRLKSGGKWKVFKFGFGACNKKQPGSPLAMTIAQVKPDNQPLTYLDKVIYDENSLWSNLKRLQLDLLLQKSVQPSEWATAQISEILIVFDQFEELFTYPTDEIEWFKKSLSEALFTQIPSNFREELAVSEGGQKDLSEPEFALLHRPLQLKVVFAIRSDRVSLLHQITDALPDLMRFVYEIKPLTIAQATEAIVEPAQLPGKFVSEKFGYESRLLKNILEFLAKDKEKYIESFQIQIICKRAEDLMKEAQAIAREMKDGPSESVLTVSKMGSLENVFLQFYESALNIIPTKASRDAAQQLVEEGLIFPTDKGGIRLNLFEEQIRQSYPDVDEDTLRHLLESRLLREEPDAANRMRYEIAHDTLVAPILNSRKTRLIAMQEKNTQEQSELRRRQEAEQKTRAIGVSGLRFNWDFAIQTLTERRAMLILGENAFIDEEGQPLMQSFIRYVKENFPDVVCFEEEQLFAMPEMVRRVHMVFALRRFYKSHRLTSRLTPLTVLQFPVIMALDSSDLLNDMFNEMATQHEFQFYNRRRYKPQNEISGQNTLIYNLFGTVEDSDSLLLTYEDFYNQLFGLLGDNKLPNDLKRQFSEAELIILLGVNFRRGLAEPIFWDLLKNSQAVRYAIGPSTGTEREELRASTVLGIDFIQADVFEFLAELGMRFEQSKVDSSGYSRYPEKLVPEKIKIAIEKGETDKAIQMLLENDTEFFRKRYRQDIVMLSGRFNYLRKKNVEGTSSGREQEVELNKINFALLNILDDIEKSQK